MSKIRKTLSKVFRSMSQAVWRNDLKKFQELFRTLHPHDKAEYFFSRQKKTRRKLYSKLTIAELAELFENNDEPQHRLCINEMRLQKATAVLKSMYADDAVDILGSLTPAQAAQYLDAMDHETAHKLRNLLGHAKGTAGSIMTTEFVSVNESSTVAAAMKILKELAPDAVTIYYIFVTNNLGKLTGIVSLRNLIIADGRAQVKSIKDNHVVSIGVDADQEEAANIIRDYDFIALPVVASDDTLLGIITVDDIVDVIDEEAEEDYSKLAAVADVDLGAGPWKGAKKRLPWLVILLFLGMITATLIGQFEDTIAKVAILGAFIPVVAGTTGNSGTQSLALVVRGIATGGFKKLTIMRHFIKEAGTALITSIICGIVLFGIIYIWKGEPYIGVVAGAALTFSIFIGTLSGSAVPLVMHKIGVDPAVASGPLITTICDIISMFIYFSIATIGMSYLI